MAIQNEARKAIYLRLLDEIEGVPISCIVRGVDEPIVLDRDRITSDNEKFTEPAGGEWVRLAVSHAERTQETMGGTGNRRFRSSGHVFVQVFTEAGKRSLQADCVADAIVKVFDAVTLIPPPPGIECLTFEAANSREGGADGKWNMVIVEAPFTYDEVK